MNPGNAFYLILFIIALGLSACTTQNPLDMLNAEDIIQRHNDCKAIYTRQIETWDSREPENLSQIYTDDIVHYDGYPAYVGIEFVTRMANNVLLMFGKWQMKPGEVYISGDKFVGTWINWGLFGLTEDDPGLEFDLIETRGDKISFWRLFYDEHFDFAPIDLDFLTLFAETWSQGNAAEIKKLYAEEAEFEDTLFGIKVKGQGEIEKHIERFLAKGKGSWSVLIPYGETEAKPSYKDEIPFPSKGGVFGITVPDPEGNPCEIKSFLILTPDENGLIIKQETFYSAETLIACGWAE